MDTSGARSSLKHKGGTAGRKTLLSSHKLEAVQDINRLKDSSRSHGHLNRPISQDHFNRVKPEYDRVSPALLHSHENHSKRIMNKNWSLSALENKSRIELVDIAQKLYIDGLFRMSDHEIANAIYKVSNSTDGTDSVPRTFSSVEWDKEDLEGKSRFDLVEIASALGIEGLFLMNKEEIIDAIHEGRATPQSSRIQASVPSYTRHDFSEHFTIYNGVLEYGELTSELPRVGGDELIATSAHPHFNQLGDVDGNAVRLHRATAWNMYALDVADHSFNYIKLEPRCLKDSPLPLPYTGININVFGTNMATLKRSDAVVFFTGLYPREDARKWSRNELITEGLRSLEEMVPKLSKLSDSRFSKFATVGQVLNTMNLYRSVGFGFIPQYGATGGYVLLSWVDPYAVDDKHPVIRKAYRDYKYSAAEAESEGFHPDTVAFASSSANTVATRITYCSECDRESMWHLINLRNEKGEYVDDVIECSGCGASRLLLNGS